MKKEQEFAQYIANDIKQGLHAFKNNYVSSTFALKAISSFNHLTG